jgi:HD-like signal output (HDOD) protein
MRVECPVCRRTYRFAEERLPAKTPVSLKCPACRKVFPFTPPPRTPTPMPLAQIFTPYGEDLKREVAENLKKLYPMPHIMLKARALAANPDADLRQISAILRTDPALASRVLKVANSAYYGRSGKVASLLDAAVLLGVRMLVQIIALVSTSKMLGSELQGFELDSGRLWRHSLTVAVTSATIATRTGLPVRDEAFMAGLLHDAGKIILNPYVMERKSAYDALRKYHPNAPLLAEQAILGFDHAETGFALCQKWNIPAPQAVAIRFHHQPSHSNASPLAYILHVADALATCDAEASAGGLAPPVEAGALAFLKLGTEDLAGIVTDAADAIETIEDDTY